MTEGGYRPDIDGLRAIAVATVALFHAFPRALPGGFVGVDVFFVISGYLITSILARDRAAGEFSFARFYGRRVRRIFPALILTLVATLAAGWTLLPPSEYRALGLHAAAGAGFAANLQLWSESGYFDAAAALKPLLHLWSLGVEEQFYILWPLALYLSRRRALMVAAAVGAVSFALNLYAAPERPADAFYLPQHRFWELMIGAGLALAQPRLDRLPASARALAAAAGLAAIALSAALIDGALPYPYVYALAPTLGAALAIAAGSGAWTNRNVLARRPLVQLGLVSYPLYLWHWPILSFVNRFIGSDKTIVLLRYRSVALITALALAVATYWLAERPLRRAYRARPFAVTLGLCAALAAVGMAGALGLPPQLKGSRLNVAAQLDLVAADLRPGKWREGACFFVPGKEADEPAAFARHQCDGGAAPRRPLILLIGDSHAAHLWPGLAETLGPRYGLAQFTYGFCPPLLYDPATGDGFRRASRCRADDAYFLQRIAAQKYDLVIASANFAQYEEQFGPGYDAAALAGARALRRTSGAPVLLVGQSPLWLKPLPYVIADRLWRSGDYPPLLATGLDARALAADARLKTVDWGEGVVYLSLTDRLCRDGACQVQADGAFPDNVMMFDANHFTDSGSRWVAQRVLAPWIDAKFAGGAPR